MPTGEDVLNVARSEIGYVQGANKDNKYGKWFGLNNQNYCVIFAAAWCYNKAGIIGDVVGRTRKENGLCSCSQTLNWYKKNSPECITKEPTPGCLVIFDFPNTGVTTDHMGLFVSKTDTTITTIDGNTSSTNQSSGGCVELKTRKFKDFATPPIYIVPKEIQNTDVRGTTMRCISGSTAEETKMIKAVQKAVGAVEDGSIGTQTISDIACLLCAECFPLSITIYSQPVIIAKDCTPFAASAPLSAYANTISGSFNDGSAPCSILVVNGKAVRAVSCHYWDDNSPETVIYRTTSRFFGIQKVKTVDELPKNISWAVGGMGLLDNYNPNAEGFKGKFSDVLRRTNHTMLGVKHGYVFLVYCANMTAVQVNNFAKKLGLKYAIMLDGGHLAAINSATTKINTGMKQLYAIQAK